MNTNCGCGHDLNLHGIIASCPERLVCPVCGITCPKPPVDFKEAWEKSIASEPDPVIKPEKPQKMPEGQPDAICTCEHDNLQHEGPFGEEGKCLKCDCKFFQIESKINYDHSPMCK